MNDFFWSLMLAAISALTFVAYRHPAGYARNIFPPLIVLAVLFLVGVMASYLGSMNSLIQSLAREMNVEGESRSLLRFTATSIIESHNTFRYSLGGGAIIVLYLLLLRYLPTLIDASSLVGEKKRKPVDGDSKD